ncbi:MAG: EAL domain-containing protein [Methylobacter sp.]|jgi:diguanylate cyclase (GGDEF)-like protein/PAS domain S-box-containing protein|nr:EAL domain-containing protein [Methylobacter sp.]
MQVSINISAAEEAAAIRAEQVRTLYANTPTAVVGNVLIAFILAVMQWGAIAAPAVIVWLAVLMVTLGVRMLLFAAHRRAAPGDDSVWLRRFRISITAIGMVWGLASLLMFPPHDLPHQVFLTFALGGMASAAITTLSIDRVSLLAFTLPALATVIVRLLFEGTEIQAAMSVMIALFLLLTDMVAQRSYRTLCENVILRISVAGRERELSSLVESSPDNIIRYDQDCRAVYVNRMLERTVDVAPESLIGKTPMESGFDGCIGIENYQAKLQQVICTGESQNVEVMVSSPGGDRRIHHIQFVAEHGGDGGVVGAFAFGRDITEQKQADEAVRRSETKFRTLYDMTGDAIMLLDEHGFFDCNKATLTIFGCATPEEFYSKHPADLSPPEQPCSTDSMTLAARRIAEAMEKGTNHFEWMHKRADTGESFPADVLLSAMELDGKTVLQAVVRDISARKQAEADLRIAAIALESLEAIAITDANQVILKVNQAFTRITGYAAEEAIGQTPGRLLKSGRQSAQFYRAMWESLSSDKCWQGEILNRRKNGEVYPQWLSIIAAAVEGEQVTHYVATFSDISQKKQAEETIHNLAFYDPLTDLPNRRLMQDRLQQALASSARNHNHGAILFIDLDNFKELNDTKGHHIGDLLLIEIAARMKACVRADDTVSRLGGDEFLVILDELSAAAEEAAVHAETVAEKIRAAIGQPFDLQGHGYHSSSSIGISLFLDHELTADELLKRADTAMYQAKRSGRNAIRFFDPATHAAMESRIALEAELRRALPENQFRLYYQMQADNIGAIFGAEALLRWQHPERGMVSPAQFIPLAEETGLIVPIGLWVLETACRQLKAWEFDPDFSHLQLAVNVSACQFHQPDFVEQVFALLTTTAVSPDKLKLELTESLVLGDINETIFKMQALKAIGVSFSIDDFGTGYSSLAYLTQLPLDQLKIDQSFVRNVVIKPGDAVIVQTIIGMATNLGIDVIAEGVETEEQRDFLEGNGCFTYQGFLFGKPVPVEDFESALIKSGNRSMKAAV